MTKLFVCVLALAACGLHEKDRCTVAGDCLDGEVCCNATCTAPTAAACGPLTRFTKLALAHTFSCGLGDNSAIYCWGGNSAGELGDGSNIPHARPAQVGAAYDWTDVAAANFIACGLKVDHSMWCWGFGINGELGDGRASIESVPTEVVSDKPGVGWKEMSLGVHFVCGLHLDGSIACWGRDRVSNTSIDKPRAVDGNSDWTHVSAGADVHCGLRGEPGKLYCWGKAFHGELGMGSVNLQPTPAQVGRDTWKTVEIGDSTACAIRSDGALFCWGNNMGTVTALHYGNVPQQIGTATDWTKISVPRWTAIGMRASTGAYAWGRNYFGAPFPDEDSEIAEPRAIPQGTNGWAELKSGGFHVCGISGNLTYCWGAINDGVLGNGATVSLARPTRIGSDAWTAIATGGGQCGLRSDGALLCWGDVPGLGAGFGNTDPVWAPARLGAETYTAVAASNAFPALATCAIRSGELVCWGDNTFGELGLGNTQSPQLSPAPVSLANVPGGTQWTEVAVGGHTCAITSSGALWCWGANQGGQLGSGAASAVRTTAPTAPLGGTWLHVAVTDYDYDVGLSCGIQTDHTLWCWGRDQPPTAAQHLVPTQVGGASSWASVAVGRATGAMTASATICAVQLDGTLWCWGQWLDAGRLNTSMIPVQVGRDADWSSVVIGGEICATKTGGTLWCWANQDWLGDGSPVVLDPLEAVVAATRPTQIGSDSDWRTVQTGGMSCATKTDGSLWCWGFGAAPIPHSITTPTLVD